MKLTIPAIAAPVILLLCFVGSSAFAGETVQPGFYSHEPAGVGIRISGARSGEICTDASGSDKVCSVATKITVEGRDNCIGTEGQQYTCTRFGYRYDFSGATPDTEIRCHATRNDGFNKREMDYTIAVESDSGSIFHPAWIPYGPVERRMMLTEVHECSYSGASLATIEYIITYEPSANPAPRPSGGPDPSIDEPFIEEVPKACNYLTRELAVTWVRDEDVQNNTSADMHVPNLQSLCMYTAIHAAERDARIQFKFHLYDFFDVEKLAPMQLLFHATFLGGGNEPQDTMYDLGKISFVYDLANDVTSLLVVTGMQGPPDGAGRPMEFTASYYLRDPGRTHEDRLVLLLEEARENLESWRSEYR